MSPSPELPLLPDPLVAAGFLSLVLLAAGLTLPTPTRPSLRGLLPGHALLGLLAVQWLLVPGLSLLALGLALPVEARSQGLALGLLLVAVTPGGKGALAFALYARADLGLVLAGALAALLLTAVLTPAWLALGIAATLSPPWPVLLETGLLLLAATLLPLALGLWIQRRLPAWRRPLHRLVQALIALALGLALIEAARGLAGLDPPGGWSRLLQLVGLHHALVLLIAETVARVLDLRLPQRRALVLASGVQNSALALPLVLLLAPGDTLAFATVALWGLWRLLAAGLLSAAWRLFRPTAPQPVTEALP